MTHILDTVQYWERTEHTIHGLTKGEVYWVIQDSEYLEYYWVMDNMDKQDIIKGELELKSSFNSCYPNNLLQKYFTRVL